MKLLKITQQTKRIIKIIFQKVLTPFMKKKLQIKKFARTIFKFQKEKILISTSQQQLQQDKLHIPMKYHWIQNQYMVYKPILYIWNIVPTLRHLISIAYRSKGISSNLLLSVFFYRRWPLWSFPLYFSLLL